MAHKNFPLPQIAGPKNLRARGYFSTPITVYSN